MAKKDRYLLPIAVFMLFIKGDEILLIKRSHTGWMDGYYSLPAGGLENNESIEKTVIRECKEEVDVSVKEEDIKLIHVLHSNINDEKWIGIFFNTMKWEGEIKVNEPHKHSEIKWVKINELPENIIPYVKQSINESQKINSYSEYGW